MSEQSAVIMQQNLDRWVHCRLHANGKDGGEVYLGNVITNIWTLTCPHLINADKCFDKIQESWVKVFRVYLVEVTWSDIIFYWC